MGELLSTPLMDEQSPSDGEDDTDDSSGRTLDRDTLLIKGFYSQNDFIKTRSDGPFAYFCKLLNFRVKIMEVFTEEVSEDESSDDSDESSSLLPSNESHLIEMSQVEEDKGTSWYEIEDTNLHKYFEAIVSVFYTPELGVDLDTDKPSKIMSKQHALMLKMLVYINRSKVPPGNPNLKNLRDEIFSLQKELLIKNTKNESR